MLHLRTAAMVLCLAFALAGCGPAADREQLVLGSRRWIVEVTNLAPRVATISMALDTLPPRQPVGRVTPGVIPANTTVQVEIIVPPGTGWAIFVNSRRQDEPLIIATDVPADESGPMPFRVVVERDGDAVVQHEDRHGWFGN